MESSASGYIEKMDQRKKEKSDRATMKNLDKQAFEEYNNLMSLISQHNSTVIRLNKLRDKYEPMQLKAHIIDRVVFL